MRKIILFLLLGFLTVGNTALQGDSFTYQGELIKNGSPANGIFDFSVNFYSQATGGAVLAGDVFTNTTVINGLFTLPIDIGNNYFSGDEVWLELTISDQGGGNSVTLPTRQLVRNAPYAIQAQYVGTNGVTESSIAMGAVSTSKLANDAVNSDKILNYSIANFDLAINSVNSSNIVDGSIINSDIATGTITQVQLATNSVGSLEIAANAVTNSKIADTAVSTNKIANDAITTAKILDGTINENDLGSGSVSSTHIADGEVKAIDIDQTQVQTRVSGACATGSSIRVIAQDGTVTCETDDVGTAFAGWSLTGNAGTNPATNFIGTSDNQPLIFKVNNTQALKLQKVNTGINTIFGGNSIGITADEDNVIGGGSGNSISVGFNHVIAGGNNNKINYGKLATISGGIGNEAIASWSAIPGGFENVAGGEYSFAAGHRAHVRNRTEVGGGDTNGDEGTFIWSQTNMTSTAPRQVLFEALGGFGIGTNAPASPLHVKGQGATFGSALSEVVMTVEPMGNTDDVSLAINKLDATRESALMFSTNETPEFDIRSVNGGALDFNSYNNVGTPSFMMRINDKATNRIDFDANLEPQVNNAYNLGSSSYRWSTIYAQNPLDTPSDKRLKKDIKNMDYGLAEILAMRPVTYHWKKGDSKRTNLGLIAQEVETIVPEIVHKEDDAMQTRSMSYSELIPILIKATQEQQVLIDKQNQQIKQLQDMVKLLVSQQK